MVSKREREKWPFAKRLGFLRLSSQELVEILTRHSNGGTVAASTKRHLFSSLDDINENVELLSGAAEVILEVDGASGSPTEIKINFDACTTVSERYLRGQAETEIEKISRDLVAHRIPFIGHITKVPPIVWMILVVALVWFIPAPGEPNPHVLSFFSKSGIAYLSLATFGALILLGVLAVLPPVYYNPKQTFWQRNRDAILVGILMLFIGYFANQFTDLSLLREE